jgi:hypothetical protein
MSDRDTSENKPVITDPSLEFDMFELVRTRLVDTLTASGYNSLEAERIAFYTTKGVRSVPLFMKVLTRVEPPSREEVIESLGRILDETAGLEKAKSLLLHQDELQHEE